jgi:hypothetical protein
MSVDTSVIQTVPHAKELETILAVEQATILPIALRHIEEKGFYDAKDIALRVATSKPADASFLCGVDTKILPQDSFHIYSAAQELFRGAYWHAFSHIEKISDEKKEMSVQLGKIAIEQTFDPIAYRWSRSDLETEPNDYGSYELLVQVISNPKSKLRHLVSVQDLERCVNSAFVSFVKNPEAFVWKNLSLNADEETQRATNWKYLGFCSLLENLQYLKKDLVLKTLEENQGFKTGWHSLLYLNYIFKRFENETTSSEKAKLFWPVLKTIMWPRESFDVLAEDKAVLNQCLKYAKHHYCKERVEREFADIITYGCGDTWQSVDFANKILGKQRLAQITEETARNSRGEAAENLVGLAVKGDLDGYINLATVYLLKSHCVPRADDRDYDLKQKKYHMKTLNVLERKLKKHSG